MKKSISVVLWECNISYKMFYKMCIRDRPVSVCGAAGACHRYFHFLHFIQLLIFPILVFTVVIEQVSIPVPAGTGMSIFLTRFSYLRVGGFHGFLDVFWGS